jgi:hypothetical protein
MNDSRLRMQKKHTVLMILWGVLICCIKGGAIIDHETPRERRIVAVEK